jgi:hypothetical protein
LLKIERNRRNPTKNASNPREEKTSKSSPFAHRFGRGINGKRTAKCLSIPPTKSQRERPQIRHKKIAKKGLRKSPKRRNGKDTSKP